MIEQDTIKKKQVNQSLLLELKREFKVKNNKKYKIKAIVDSTVYNKKINNQMLDFYYLILWKSYLKDENI